MGHDEILTIPEVGELLKIAEKTVYALAQRRELPAFKVGGQWRFSRSAINEWIEAQTRSADANPATAGRRDRPPGPGQSRKGR
jgi:excisionase family DNA binding protein